MEVLRPVSPAFLELSRSIRGFELRKEGEVVFISGVTNTYYQKQLVQEAVRAEYPGFEIRNGVGVT